MKSDDLDAARKADWMQVVYNQGPPCFHLDNGRFCLRAERWDGHRKTHKDDILIHKFVSMEDLLRQTKADVLRHAAELCGKVKGYSSAEFAINECVIRIEEAAVKLEGK